MQVKGILNLREYQNFFMGSTATAISLNAWILPFGIVALERVCTQPRKKPCLFFICGAFIVFVKRKGFVKVLTFINLCLWNFICFWAVFSSCQGGPFTLTYQPTT